MQVQTLPLPLSNFKIQKIHKKMNKVTIPNAPEFNIEYKPGDIFTNKDKTFTYIAIQDCFSFCEDKNNKPTKCLCLENGLIYDFSEGSVKEDYLIFVGRNMEIVLKHY